MARKESKLKAHKCNARCANFKKYGKCDRLTTKPKCYQHTPRAKIRMDVVKAK